MKPLPTAVTDSTEMAQVKLTDAAISKALKSKKAQTLRDGTGRGTGRLLLSVRPGISAEWYAQRFVDGKRQLKKLGNYPTVTLADARQRHSELIWDAVPAASCGTIGEMFADYVEALRSAGKRSWKDVDNTLSRMAKAIGQKPANAVSSSDIIAVIRPVYAEGKASMADHMRCYVRSAYGWALKAQNDYRSEAAVRYPVTFNPAENIPTEAKVSGDRWLTVDELRSFWRWLSDGGGHKNPNRNINPDAYKVLMLIAATGQRVEEICRIDRSMVNWKLMTIEWPTTKPGRPHVIPISIQAAEILHRIEPNEHGLYFPAEYGASRPMRDHTLRVVVGRFCAQEGVEHFCPRDLRRTWKTLSGVAGISKSDRDRLQNHSQSDVSSKHYDRYDYLPEKRAAMLQWGKWFEREIEKKKPR